MKKSSYLINSISLSQLLKLCNAMHIELITVVKQIC